MVPLIILFILLGLLFWILVSPIQLIIDTNQQVYCIRWRGLGRFGLKILPGDLVLRFDSWLFHKDYHPLAQSKKKKPKNKKKKEKKKSKFDFKKYSRKAFRMIKTFKIKSFFVNLDTDDYILNGYLYPIFYFLGKRGEHMNINFKGDLEINIVAENRLYKVVRAMLF